VTRVWRFCVAWGLDVLIVAAAAASAVGTLLRTDAERPEGALLWLEAAAISLLMLVLLARKQLPFLAPLVLWIGAPALSFIDGMAITSQPAVFLCGMGAAVLLGALADGVRARVGLLCVLVGAATVVLHDPAHESGDFLFTPALFAIGWLFGFALRERNERAATAEERALRAERERESAARLAVAEERTRMARELHDVVAHAMSVMVLQVGAVRRRMPDSAAEEREALDNVEQAGRTALVEMRRLLGALRASDDEPELAPQPGLANLSTLVCDVRAAGLDVRLRIEGDHTPLPHGVDLAAYRIVQEGLTNALKHAHAAHADVTVRFDPGGLSLEVRDDGRGGAVRHDGLGHGLIGIGERVKIHGGDMSAFVPVTGGFVVRARLPLDGGVA
jgi:signal transduction histidine kinase